MGAGVKGEGVDGEGVRYVYCGRWDMSLVTSHVFLTKKEIAEGEVGKEGWRGSSILVFLRMEVTRALYKGE